MLNAEDYHHSLMKECARRRQQLFNRMSPGSIAILKGGKIQYKSHDTEYPFQQNKDFHYLTGFPEPDALLVFIKHQEGKNEFILFCRGKNVDEELWTGPRLGIQGACEHFGADQAFDIEDLDKMMPKFMQDKTQCYHTLGIDHHFDHQLFKWVSELRKTTRKGGDFPHTWLDFMDMIHEMRLIKSPFEIELMRKAAEITAVAHQKLMEQVKSKDKEYLLEAEFVYECAKEGAREMAYPPIVGGGKNACILHYTHNHQTLKNGDLVLVDAGCNYKQYASDVTRTYPVNGRFTAEQKAIYELVLSTQEAAIKRIKPNIPWDQIQTTIVRVMVEGLIALDILKGDVEKLIEDKAYLPFYMHSSGHWLGLDVHDVGNYKLNGEWRPLIPGMVLTVEPGIYIGPHHANIDHKWKGIGVRIEDDVLVTEHGCDVLTHQAPKRIQDIEQLMKASRDG